MIVEQPTGSVLPSDKMSYKNILQMLVAKCLESQYDKDLYDDAVETLKTAMYFNSSRLNYRDKIDAILPDLDKWYEDKKARYDQEHKGWYQLLSAIPEYRNYRHKRNYNLFIQLLNILSESGMLTEGKGRVEEGGELKL